MSLFGLFYAAFVGSTMAINKHKENKEDKFNKNRAINDGDLTYFDHRGVERLVSNDHMVLQMKNHMREDVLKDLDTGRVIRNYSKEAEQEALEEARKKSKDIHFEIVGIVKDLYPELIKRVHRGTLVYKCVDNNNYYMKLRHGYYWCWLNIEKEVLECFDFDDSSRLKEWCKSENEFNKEYGHDVLYYSKRELNILGTSRGW